MDQKNLNAIFNENIKNLLHGDKWEDRAKAALNLGHMEDGRAVNLLIKALNKEKEPAVVNRIIEALGNIKNSKATMPILQFLKEENNTEYIDKTRLFIIIESLMKIGDKRALSDLGILLDSCEEDIRTRTEEAFNCIDPNWRDNLEKQTIDPA